MLVEFLAQTMAARGIAVDFAPLPAFCRNILKGVVAGGHWAGVERTGRQQ